MSASTPISKDTKVTIGFAMILFSGILWILKESFDTRLEIVGIKRDVTEIQRDLQRAVQTMSDRWTRTDMYAYVRLLQAENPGLKLPEVLK